LRNSFFVRNLTLNLPEKIVCYWYAEIDASQISPAICTHIIYSFLGVDAQGGLNHLDRTEAQAAGNLILIEEVFEILTIHIHTTVGYINKLLTLKSQNPNLKFIAAVGGYNEALVPAWSSLAANFRSNFAKNVLFFLQKYNLNGIGELCSDF
jgi:chitinase